MVQEYLLGGPCKTIKLNDFIFGYKNDRLDNLYDQFKFQEGKEVALQQDVNPILDVMTNQSMSQVVGMYTGALKIDNVGKIRFNNDRNYLNKFMPIFDGNNMSYV